MVKLQVLNLQLFWKINSAAKIFQLIYYLLRTTAYQGKFRRKEYEFWNAMYIMLIKEYCSSHSRCDALRELVPFAQFKKRKKHQCTALHFQLLQLVRLTDPWSTFYETKMNGLKNGQKLFSSAINKKERETESTVWKFTMKNIVDSLLKVYGNYNMSLLMSE